MIVIENIDIFKKFVELDNVAMAQCCNCMCTMGSGIARAIREKYPSAYEADCETKAGDKEKLGGVTYANIKGTSRYIFNIYGQYDFGTSKRQLNYEAMYTGLQITRDYMKHIYGIPVLLIPYKMGCDRAGGDFRIVNTMLNVLFEDGFADVIICKL
jgi:O-acetyl-ADP-ribose deacetylase (regulator of RNase III)